MGAGDIALGTDADDIRYGPARRFYKDINLLDVVPSLTKIKYYFLIPLR